METNLQINRILIAVEDSPYSDKASAYGVMLAGKMKSEVALVHVSDVAIATSYVGDPLIAEPQLLIPDMMEIQEQAGKKLLDRISDHFSSETTIFTFNKVGNPTDEILATAEEWRADLIILGTHGRTGLDHFITGSVAEGVCRKAKCAVLVVPNPK
ncbi:universal stress protein [Hufsiella ginkgonis]|uniref:Universal stress protein n=1 Tax=Hufsiella ginkgonis TaxID=2695274 RepID=A0A7K1XVX7_9SPHI|nr:universal stress protein [Hufsiella ginkgonis]MXV15132.1 universal stress protein [Hufsiella ginkgonis]